ncbi:DUF1822 family protein [Anabaena sphaerica FACHB-251]|uniref:DUF1822 family protein n=1 Tax=Anabaena sphaerica FACHB-251 TaxID=2692883 RepID=A0A926WKP2_9NOST|nr:DUF1822 family protein [Anabaena sphaerica]MBD2296371.1 DUF1822 family protein [Anabaena sphaerica FACHB-251]
MSPKFMWLEAEHFEEAKKISGHNLDEAQQWKIYLNALALLGFEQWVSEKNRSININRDNCSIFHPENANATDVVSNLKLGDFNLCLITVDNLSDDFVALPQEFINSLEIAAHFYVLIEVLEEEEKLKVHGFLRQDQLIQYCQSMNFKNQADGRYLLPLAWLDHELNNLLLSARFLEATAIPLVSAVKANPTVILSLNNTKNIVSKTIVNLSNWLSGVFDEGWQSTGIIWKTLPINLDVGFARSVNKSNNYEVSGTKIFDFGLMLNGENFALVVNQKRAENNEKDILVQVLPRDKQYLPSGLKLKVTLNPNTSESESQEVTARKADNAIQLEFSESPDKQFQVEVSFNDAVVTEDFLL